MLGTEHMKAATRKFKSLMEQEANRVGQTLKDYLKRKEFNDDQIDDIISGESKIENYTWHHHQETGRMQLINEVTHETASIMAAIHYGEAECQMNNS